jgi:hypothetical protein
LLISNNDFVSNPFALRALHHRKAKITSLKIVDQILPQICQQQATNAIGYHNFVSKLEQMN